MVSTIDPNEESWNHLQRQLSNHRENPKKKTVKNVNKKYPSSKTPSTTYTGNFSNNLSKRTQSLRFENPLPNKTTPRLQSIRKDNEGNNNNYVSNSLNNLNSSYNNNSSQNIPGSQRSSANAFQVPLPDIDNSYAPNQYQAPNLESWGIKNSSARNNELLYSSYRYNPSPLLPMYNFLTKERKSYMVVPKLRQEYFSPVTNNKDFDTNYNYITAKPYSKQFNDTFTKSSNNAEEYDYFKTNTSFSNQYIEEFIAKTLQDQIIPDLLIETIASVKREIKKTNSQTKLFKDPLKDAASDLLYTVDKNISKETDLFSTKFIDDLEHKVDIKKVARTPSKRLPMNIQAELDEIKKTDYKIVSQPEPQNERQIVSESPAPLINMEVFKLKAEKEAEVAILRMREEETRKLQQRLAIEQVITEDVIHPTVLLMCKQIANEVLSGYKNRVDTLQKIDVKKYSNEHLLETFMLDHLLRTMSTHGRLVSENDDVNKLVDVMILDILLYTQNEVRKTKSKTLDNYPLKKFHLNSYMNLALDTLLDELSTNLEEDMKDLEEDENKYFRRIRN